MAFYYGIKGIIKQRTVEGRRQHGINLQYAKRYVELQEEWEDVTNEDFEITDETDTKLRSDFANGATDFEITCKYAPIEYLRKTYGYGHPVVTKRVQEMEKQGTL